MASEKHKCRACRRELIPRSSPDLLARWCGEWFDHPLTPLGECSMGTVSVLEPSDALLAQDAELKAEGAQIREKAAHG